MSDRTKMPYLSDGLFQSDLMAYSNLDSENFIFLNCCLLGFEFFVVVSVSCYYMTFVFCFVLGRVPLALAFGGGGLMTVQNSPGQEMGACGVHCCMTTQ